MSDCVFCRIIRGEIPARIVHSDDTAVAFADLAPQAPTHLLIVPKRHLGSLAEARPEDGALFGHLVSIAIRLAEQAGLEAGFRLVVNTGPAAGQSVEHLHVHLLGGRTFDWPPG
jgi:histidine triad (HIT) family protein